MPIPRLCPNCQIVVYTGERHCKVHNIPMRAICQGCKKDVCTISKWARHAKKCQLYQDYLKRSEKELQPDQMKDDPESNVKDHQNDVSFIKYEPPTPPMNMNFTESSTTNPQSSNSDHPFEMITDMNTLNKSLNKLLNFQQKVPENIRSMHENSQDVWFDEPVVEDVLPSLKDLPLLSQQPPRKRLKRPRPTSILQKCMLHYGPMCGNQFVAVYGTFDLFQAEPVHLYFGNAVAHIIDVHPSHIHCLTPSASHPGRVKVTLTVHTPSEVKMSKSDAYYEYVGPSGNTQAPDKGSSQVQQPDKGPSSFSSSLTSPQGNLFDFSNPDFSGSSDFFDMDDTNNLFQMTFRKNMYGHTMAHICVIHSWISKLKYVINLHINLFQRDHFGRTPFHYAAIQNDLAALKELIASQQFQKLSESRRKDLFYELQDSYGHSVADYTSESFFEYVDLSLSSLDMVRHYHQFVKFYDNKAISAFEVVHPPTDHDAFTHAKYVSRSHSIYLISRRRRFLHFRYDHEHFLSLHEYSLNTNTMDIITFRNEPNKLNFFGATDSALVCWENFLIIQTLKDTFIIYNLKSKRVHFMTLRPNFQGVPMTTTYWFHPKLGLFFSLENNHLYVVDIIDETVKYNVGSPVPFFEGNLKYAATCVSNDYSTLYVSFGIFDNNSTSFLYNRQLAYNDGLFAYNLFTKKWSVLSRHPQLVRNHHAMAPVPGRSDELIILGGSHQDKGYLNDIWIFSNSIWRCVHVHGTPFQGNKFSLIMCPSSKNESFPKDCNSPYFWKDVKHACVQQEDHDDDDELELKRFDLVDAFQELPISNSSFSLFAVGGLQRNDQCKTYVSYQMTFSPVQEQFLSSSFPHFTDVLVSF